VGGGGGRWWSGEVGHPGLGRRGSVALGEPILGASPGGGGSEVGARCRDLGGGHGGGVGLRTRAGRGAYPFIGA
jgi:hypothetical protein